MHLVASETEDDASLAAEREAEVSEVADQTKITVPLLNPWGILVLNRQQASDEGHGQIVSEMA